MVETFLCTTCGYRFQSGTRYRTLAITTCPRCAGEVYPLPPPPPSLPPRVVARAFGPMLRIVGWGFLLVGASLVALDKAGDLMREEDFLWFGAATTALLVFAAGLAFARLRVAWMQADHARHWRAQRWSAAMMVGCALSLVGIGFAAVSEGVGTRPWVAAVMLLVGASALLGLAFIVWSAPAPRSS